MFAAQLVRRREDKRGRWLRNECFELVVDAFHLELDVEFGRGDRRRRRRSIQLGLRIELDRNGRRRRWWRRWSPWTRRGGRHPDSRRWSFDEKALHARSD